MDENSSLFAALARVAIALRKPYLRQKDLAVKLGVSEATVTRMLLGHKEIPQEMRVILCRELDLAPFLGAVAARLEGLEDEY